MDGLWPTRRYVLDKMDKTTESERVDFGSTCLVAGETGYQPYRVLKRGRIVYQSENNGHGRFYSL